MSSSIICQNFVQNAWKKELCSNCFKSKDEHRKPTNNATTNNNNNINTNNKNNNNNKMSTVKTSALTTALLNKNVANLLQKPSLLSVNKSSIASSKGKSKEPKSIIKTTFGNSKSKHKRSVNFKTNLTQVIGYGGEDWSEEEEDVVAYEESNETEPPSEEERELVRLTKSNTDYNTNLTVKKLQLGRPLVDAEGRKQTLLVQVTPFGQDTPPPPPSRGKSSSDILEKDEVDATPSDAANNKRIKSYFVKEIGKEENEKFKEVTEEVNDVNETKELLHTSIQKSGHAEEEKSLLDEITETLEKGRNPIIVKKIVQKEIILAKPGMLKEAPKVPGSKLSRNPVIKEKKTFQTSKCLNLTTAIDKSESDHGKEPFDDKDSANGSSSIDDSSSHCGSEDSNSTDSSLDTQTQTKNTNKAYENVGGLHGGLQSRELVGEPDGRAESDGTSDEPVPALPATPPPQVPAPMSPEKAKPKIPTKPSTILIRKPPSIMSMTTSTVNQVILSTFNCDKSQKAHMPLQKRDSNGSDISKKRKAPKPPANDETSNSIYTRNPGQIANTDCPVVREKEKRERASSCSPKVNLMPRDGPEPAPRRSLSLSSDSLASGAGEDKKKRGKFSLKKLLRMGQSSSKSDASEEKPLPKPRLVIVHPLELKAKEAQGEAMKKEQEYVNTTFIQEQIKLQNAKADIHHQQNRPPPPPRNYENYEPKPDASKLPPKTSQIKHLQTASIMNAHGVDQMEKSKKPLETVYANIGEVRNAITPNKPQRTASMREIKEGVVVNQYEPIAQNCSRSAKDGTEHVYDYIGGNRSSSPECDSKKGGNAHGHGIAAAGTGMSRSVSLTYCGSETESEIYSPYSYYGSESEVAEDDQECCYGNGLGSTGRTHKLRSKKGRSIVHKNLEDNYGAVVIANHEALAQVLENIQQTVHVPLALRALKTTENLRWNDFQLRTSSQLSNAPLPSPPAASIIVIGNCTFHQAAWNLQALTLMMTVVPNSPSFSLGTFTLQPVTEFSDLVPSAFLPRKSDAPAQPTQATVSVLPHLQINSMSTVGEQLKAHKSDDIHKCSTLILLQLVNGLKALQAQGVEELPLSLDSFVLAKEIEKQEAHSRLYILQPNEAGGLQPTATLCLIVSKALSLLPMDALLQRLVHSLLQTERAVALSQVKSVLEFSLWGPSDVALGSTTQEREFVLQRWLDLQRATVLHGLVCAKVQLTVYEECHLLFLVRSNAKMMCDASLLLESVRC